MSTFPDRLYQMGGVPVGGANTDWFAGWWGKDIYFVDYDNGSDGNTGKSITLPYKNLNTALSAASADDTIYVRPRDFSTEDPQQITPSTSTNFTIATADHGLCLIGTGKGLGHAAAHQTWIGTYSGTATAVLTINAPGCVIENFRAQPGSSTVGIFASTNDATYDGGNTTIINCDFHDATTAGGINLGSTWQMSIVGNRFLNCDKGIYVTSSYSVPQIFHVWDNQFIAETGEVYADLHALGGIKRFLAWNNYHAADTPTAGAPNKYYCFSAASTGMIANCFFGCYDTTPTDTELFTLDGVQQSGNYGAQYLVTSSS